MTDQERQALLAAARSELSTAQDAFVAREFAIASHRNVWDERRARYVPSAYYVNGAPYDFASPPVITGELIAAHRDGQENALVEFDAFDATLVQAWLDAKAAVQTATFAVSKWSVAQ